MLCLQYTILRRETAREKQGKNRAAGAAKKYFEKSILEKEINNALVKVRLEKYKYFYPRELSGGMRQRINFARALIGNPEVILMDEPFKSLDIKSKNNMIELIKNLKNTDITIILVTHDINEILMLEDVV